MKKRKKEGVILLQILVAVVLVIMIYNKMKSPVMVVTDLSDMHSDYMEYTENGWVVADEEAALNDGKTLIYGPYAKIRPGSYTLYLEYATSATRTCEIYSKEKQAFVHANKFYLSHNKQNVKYDFYITSALNDLAIRMVNYDGGEFTLSAMQIYENTHNLRLILFMWIIVSLVLDWLLFQKWAKRNRTLIAVIVGISILPSVVLFMRGMGMGHDSGFHLQRIESIAEGIKNATFPVKMYTTYNDGYGYPVGIYYGDLLLYIPALLRICGFSVISAYKIFVYVVNLLTTVIGVWSFERILKNRKTAILVTLVYITASYRFVDLYVRMAVGEYVALMFLPLIALAVWNIYKMEITDRAYKKNSILLAGGMLGLLYSHILSIEMVTATLAVIAIVCCKKTFRKETMLVYIKAIMIFLVLGAAFIVPFLDYFLHTKIVLTQNNNSSMLIQTAGAYISDYFAVFRDYYGNAAFAVTARMQLTPGLLLMLGLLIAFCLIVTKKATKDIKCMAGISIILLFVASCYFPWNQLEEMTLVGKIMTQVQFPWRFIGLALVPLSILLGLLSEELVCKKYCERKSLYVAIALGSVVMSCAFVSSYEDNVTQVSYLDSAELTEYTYNGDIRALAAPEYLLLNTDIERLDYVVKGEYAKGYIVSEKGLDMIINVDADQNSYIEIPRFYYPNYQALNENGESYSLETGDNNKIRILFPNKTNGEVYIRYVEPWYWRVSEIISFMGICVLLIWNYKKGRKKL